MTTVDNQTPGGSSSVSTYGYTYDALGRRGDRSQSGSAINTPSTDDFAYNSRSEVTALSNTTETATAWNPTFAYDKIGNRLSSTGGTSSASSVSYTTNSLNQYTQVSGLSSQPSHDADGNLVASGAWTYSWNNENRLASATNGTTTLNFTYDYQGRLIKKDNGTDVEVYVYDGWNRIATFRSQVSGLSLHETYLWGLDLSGSMQGAGGVGGLLKEGNLYPTFDANGNIMQKLDGTGTVAMSVDYDPFGSIINGTLVGEYGFSTKPLIEGILMYYYGFRYYDPVTGRWPSRDPIKEDGGINIYAMIRNRAVNHFDYLGLFDAAQCCENVRSACVHECSQAGGQPGCVEDCNRRARDCVVDGGVGHGPCDPGFQGIPNFYTPCKLEECEDDCLNCCDIAAVVGSVYLLNAVRTHTLLCSRIRNPNAAAACMAGVATWNLTNLAVHTARYATCRNDCSSKL